ncbi:Chemotaxis protein CheW [compost metagenome]
MTSISNSTPDILRQAQVGTTQTLLAFSVGGNEFAVEMTKVRELQDPESLNIMRGDAQALVEIGGEVLPVFDLRQVLNVPHSDAGASPLMLVFDLGARVVAALVDALTDVVTVSRAALRRVDGLAYASVEGRQLALFSPEHLQPAQSLAMAA